MVTLLLELVGLALIVTAAVLVDIRLAAVVLGTYLMWTARSA